MKTSYKRRISSLLVPALILCFSIQVPASAALHDRGGGLLYDDVLDVTWLQDASYSKTSGYDSDGHMGWNQANAWVANLEYSDEVRGVVYTDWRLPTTGPVNGVDYNGKFSFDGSTDEGYNISSPASELGYMFHVNLGLKGYYDTLGIARNDFGVLGNGQYGTRNVGPVINLRSTIYWTGSPQAEHPALNAWMFDSYWGYQNFYSKWDELGVWAVRDGDVLTSSSRGSIVSSVPEPGQWLLLMSGSVALLVFQRKRNSWTH